jgi:hypothetical protein
VLASRWGESGPRRPGSLLGDRNTEATWSSSLTLFGAPINGLHSRCRQDQLRRKIESEPAQPRYLKTDAGVGYRLVDE